MYHQPDNILVVGGITLDRFFLKHRCLVISFLFIPMYDHDPKMTNMFFWFMISKKGIPMLNWYILVEVLRLLTCGANNLRNEKLMDKDFASLVMQLDLSWESTHLGADKVRKNVHYRNPEKRRTGLVSIYLSRRFMKSIWGFAIYIISIIYIYIIYNISNI